MNFSETILFSRRFVSRVPRLGLLYARENSVKSGAVPGTRKTKSQHIHLHLKAMNDALKDADARGVLLFSRQLIGWRRE